MIRKIWRKIRKKIELKRLRVDIINRVSKAETCYPRVQHKATKQVVDEIFHLWLAGKGSWDLPSTVNHYFLFGLDCIGRNVDDYVFQKEYDELRNALNKGWDPLLSNKRVAAVYLSRCGLSVSTTYGIAERDGNLTMLHGSVRNFKEWLFEHMRPVFCKPNDGVQGVGCFKAEACETVDGVVYKMNGRNIDEDFPLCGHLVEDCIEQHHVLTAISPDAVNPLRVRTLRRGGRTEFVSAYMCFAPSGSYVSNGAACGIMVPVDENGVCLGDGLCEVDGTMRGRYGRFIGTEVEVKGFVIPFVREAIMLACRAHDALPELCVIGWDIAITESGPVFIEGNADYGTCTYQAVSGMGERHFVDNKLRPLL